MKRIESFPFFCYNKIRKERSTSMNLKKLKAQVSIFLSDGIMNPNKYKKNINDIFNDLFNNEILSLSIRNAPDDIPLVNYTSKDNAFSYNF